MDSERDHQQGYDPPEVEDLPVREGPAVTAAGKTLPPDGGGGPEWRPTAPEGSPDDTP